MPSLLDHALRTLGHLRAPAAHRMVNRLRPSNSYADSQASFVTKFAGLDYQGSLTEHIDREIFYFGAYAPGAFRLECRRDGLSAGGNGGAIQRPRANMTVTLKEGRGPGTGPRQGYRR